MAEACIAAIFFRSFGIARYDQTATTRDLAYFRGKVNVLDEIFALSIFGIGRSGIKADGDIGSLVVDSIDRFLDGLCVVSF